MPRMLAPVIGAGSVPAGGLNGQVLVKSADNDYALTWAAAPASAPSGPAGGVLSGTYPNPDFAQPMATDASVVHIAGTETISGAKTFSLPLTIGTSAATTGAVRLANAQGVIARNAANTTDVTLGLLDASDRVNIGTNSSGVYVAKNASVGGPLPMSDRLLAVAGTVPGAQTSTYGASVIPTAPTTATSNVTGLYVRVDTPASAFTMTSAYGAWIATPSIGAGSAINTVYGLLISAQTGGANNSFGVAIGESTTATLQLSYATNPTTAAGGMVFGSSRDTNLYRSAASTLKTDSAYVVGGTYASVGTNPAAAGALRLSNNVSISYRNQANTADVLALTVDTSNNTVLNNTGGGTGLLFQISASTKASLGTTAFSLSDGVNLAVGTTTGSQIGTATGQKLAFYGATPVVQQANTVALDTVLSTLGLRAAGGTANFATNISAPNLGAAAFLNVGTTAGTVAAGDDPRFSSGGGTGGPPTGAAGGVLSGTYPNPGFAQSMASTSDLNAAIAPLATDATVVHIAGTETVTGAKSFSSKITVTAVSSEFQQQQTTGPFTANSALQVRNTNNTTNNSSEISFYGQGGNIAAGISTTITDHANGYGDLRIYGRGASGGFKARALFGDNQAAIYSIAAIGGASPSTDRLLFVNGTVPGSQTSVYGMSLIPTAPATSTAGFVGLYLRLDTAASTFAVANAIGMQVIAPNLGVGSSLTNLYGILVNPMTAATGGNFGIAVGKATTATLWVGQDQQVTDAAGGISFGSGRDTQLYRSAAAVLSTNGNFIAQSGTANAVALGNVSSSPGITFGADVTMRRYYADQLTLEDSLWVGPGTWGGIPQPSSSGPELAVSGTFKGQFTHGNVFVSSSSTQAAGQGGALTLGGLYDATNNTPFARIAGLKNSGTSGDFGGYLALSTRPSGGNMTERVRIDQAGATHFSSANPTGTLGTNLLTNGTFDTDLSGWTAGAGWAWDPTAVAKHTTGNTATLAQTLNGLTVSGYYVLTYTITGRTAGSVTFSLGSYVGSSSSSSSAQTLIPAATTADLTITPTTDFDGSVDSITLQLVTISSAYASLDTTLGTVSRADFRADANGNLAYGVTALQQSVNAVNNVAIGTRTLQFSVGAAANLGGYNTALGVEAGQANTDGRFNSYIGYRAGYRTSRGDSNTVIGYSAMTATATALTNNTVVGVLAASALSSGTSNTIVGYGAGQYATTAPTNVIIGYNAGALNAGSGLTTGDLNVFVGSESGLYSATQVGQSVALGRRSAVGGNYAIAIGSGVSAQAAGSVAIGVTSAGVAAAATALNSIVLGTSGHSVSIPGSIGTTLTLADAVNIVLGTTTGTKIGSATSQKLGFWNATPVTQPVVNGFYASDSDNTIGTIKTVVQNLMTALTNLGLITVNTPAPP